MLGFAFFFFFFFFFFLFSFFCFCFLFLFLFFVFCFFRRHRPQDAVHLQKQGVDGASAPCLARRGGGGT